MFSNQELPLALRQQEEENRRFAVATDLNYKNRGTAKKLKNKNEETTSIMLFSERQLACYKVQLADVTT